MGVYFPQTASYGKFWPIFHQKYSSLLTKSQLKLTKPLIKLTKINLDIIVIWENSKDSSKYFDLFMFRNVALSQNQHLSVPNL